MHCVCCRQGVMPDIVTMAKGIGNGLPLAAVVTTPEIAQVRRPQPPAGPALQLCSKALVPEFNA
jgi:acetylornithine/succinyldiaminopimelate/putrescine aminotransferase